MELDSLRQKSIGKGKGRASPKKISRGKMKNPAGDGGKREGEALPRLQKPKRLTKRNPKFGGGKKRR